MLTAGALAPGRWLVFGFYASSSSALGQGALANLRTVRGGGHPWTTQQGEELLRTAGFQSVETLSPIPSVLLVIGRSNFTVRENLQNLPS
jgi:hypothetical protein